MLSPSRRVHHSQCSTTGSSAIKRLAKLLMMIEAMVSLGIGALVVARAINILK